MDARIVLTTAPDREAAERIARALVERRLVACVNLVAGVRSVYRWKGEIAEADEVLLVAKTAVDRLEGLERALKELHPYDVPEFIVLPIVDGNDAYLRWISDSTRISTA